MVVPPYDCTPVLLKGLKWTRLKDKSVSRHHRRSTSHDPTMSATTPIIIHHSSEDVENVMDDVFSEDLDAFNTPIGTYVHPFF